MAEYLVKIVPKDPFCKISEPILKKAQEFLKSILLCDSIKFECYDTPVFIDCGSNLEQIICPKCNANLNFSWWEKAMNQAFENQFMSLETELPCCKKMVSLNNLKYHFPCAFACCTITVSNSISDVEDEIVDHVQKILCTEIRVIKAHI